MSADDKDTSEETGKGETIDISGTTAPSIGPDTVIVKEDPGARLARHDQSGVDAMGLDKRRAVIGGKFGASFARQATLYGIFLAVTVALVIGALLLVDSIDQPPASNPDAAPWADNEIESTPLQ